MVFGLFGKTVPKTVDNFVALATGEVSGWSKGKQLHVVGVKQVGLRSGPSSAGTDTSFTSWLPRGPDCVENKGVLLSGDGAHL